ncbi:MAG: hypothetical protein V4617_14570 [Gemmatimonadota bacterium]
MPLRKDSGWVTIRTGGDARARVPAGTRITPAVGASLATLVSATATEPVIRTQPRARGWRLQLLHITARPDAKTGYTMLELGNATETTVAQLPSQLVLDRMYIHGTPTLDFQRCIALNSASTAIVDSWISECHGRGYDSQAIMGWNGTGPYKIVNNFLEGAGENVMFGGADPGITGVVPADIEIRRNHFFKPLSWQGVWTVKNSFELKIGLRVLVEGNVFENSWRDGQDGFGIMFKSVNQGGNAPWSQTADVTFRYNVVRNVANGMALAGQPEALPVVRMSRMYIGQNSFEQVGTGGGRFDGGRVFQISRVDDLTLESNTGVGTAFGFEFHDNASQRLVLQNNVVGLSEVRYGNWQLTLASANGKGGGAQALAFHAPGAVVRRNLFWGNSSGYLPADNLFPADPRAVGFVAFPANLELRATSQFRGAGADFKRLRAMTDSAVVTPAAR